MRIAFLIVGLLVASPAFADLSLNYTGVFARMKKVQDAKYSDITLAIALTGEKSGKACSYYSLRILSDKHDAKIDMAENGDLSLPYDEALKNSNAIIEVLQADNAEPCVMQFKLRSRMLIDKALSFDDINHYRQQFDVFLDDIAGLGKYWLPEVTGVIAEFIDEPELTHLSDNAKSMTSCEAKRCTIRLNEERSEGAKWEFTKRPIYLMPLIEKNAG